LDRPQQHPHYEVELRNPYESMPNDSFWKLAVASRNVLELSELWNNKIGLVPADKIITAGSCFAQHISKALKAAKYNWKDYEPAPEIFLPDQARMLGYGVYSFRTGNIYTVRLLRQWIDWAFATKLMNRSDEVWETDGRWYDPFRPAIEPDGFDSIEEVLASRNTTLRSVKSAFLDADVFVFTLGLTEAWMNKDTGETYPICPGTTAGRFDGKVHSFFNSQYPFIAEDAKWIISFLKEVNPKLRILLTVSPVPLVATATGQHVLTATSYSKSVLRAVAGDLAQSHEHVDYFPSYEIISSFPYKGIFFEPNMREVSKAGVSHVMKHFMAGLSSAHSGVSDSAVENEPTVDMEEADYLFCEEADLEKHA
jgi:hypothetical protein